MVGLQKQGLSVALCQGWCFCAAPGGNCLVQNWLVSLQYVCTEPQDGVGIQGTA